MPLNPFRHVFSEKKRKKEGKAFYERLPKPKRTGPTEKRERSTGLQGKGTKPGKMRVGKDRPDQRSQSRMSVGPDADRFEKKPSKPGGKIRKMPLGAGTRPRKEVRA